MGRYVDIDAGGIITLKLPPEHRDRSDEIIDRIEERFGFEGLTTQSESEIDRFVRELIEPAPA